MPNLTPPAPLPAAKTEPKAVTSLVLGILSVTILSVLAGIPAIVSGHMARSAIKRNMGGLKGAGMALAGLVMGYLSIVLFIILGGIAITIPLMMRARQAAQESAAIAQLRTINTAEITYLSASGGYGTIPELISAGLLDDRFAKTTTGYALEVQASPRSYTATATPISSNSGRFGYLSSENTVVRYQNQTSSTCDPCFPSGQAGSPLE
jgi:type II secretory pathway pseudopilin PulG